MISELYADCSSQLVPGVCDAVAGRSREEMILSIRFRDARDKVCDISPPYIRLWTEILGPWPALTNGGCRFLLQCRQWLPVQMRALARAKIQWSDDRVIRLPLEADLEYSRFGLTTEEIGDQAWTHPVPGGLRMVRPPGVKVAMLEFDISKAWSCDIGRACSATGRCQKWSILEWVLSKPEVLKKFFIRITEEEGFRRFYTNLYNLLRLAHLRIFNEKVRC